MDDQLPINQQPTSDLRRLEKDVEAGIFDDSLKCSPLIKSIVLRGIRSEINSRFTDHEAHTFGAPESPFVLNR